MGLHVSKIYRSYDYLDWVENPWRYIDGGDRYPSAELNIPTDETNWLDEYTLDDLDKILQEYYDVFVSDDSFFVKESQINIDTQYMKIKACMEDSTVKKYEIHPSSHEDAESMLNALLRLIARTTTFTNCTKLHIRSQLDTIFNNGRPLEIDLDGLRTFLNRTTANGSKIIFESFKFNAEQGAILASSALQPNVELVLCTCVFEDNGLLFAQGLANNNGPAKLEITDYCVIARESTLSLLNNIYNALADNNDDNNTTLKEFRCYSTMDEETFMSLGTMLLYNNGLISLDLKRNDITGKKSFLKCLHNHPTLECLKASSFLPSGQTITDEERIQMKEPVIELVKQNSILKEIKLYNDERPNPRHCYDERLIRTEVQPRLEINRYRPRMLEIRNEVNDIIRSKLLGEFLVDTHLNLSLIWMVVRDNHTLIIDKIQRADYNIKVAGVGSEPAFKKPK